jgi:hypothetical protein
MFAQHELLQKPGSGTVCNGMITSSFTRNGTSRTAARSKTSYEIFELKIKMQTCVQLVEFYMYQLVEFHMYQLVELYMYQLVEFHMFQLVEFYMYQLVEFYMYQLVEFCMYQLVEFPMYQLPHNDGHTCVECIECY